MRLQVLDGDSVEFDRIVSPEAYQDAQGERDEAARRVRLRKRTARVLITDANDGSKIYETFWRP